MTPLDYTLLFGFAVANPVAFILMGVDKQRARKGRDRLSERMLLVWCGCLGALGGWLGMQMFRHKTRKPLFSITVPVLLLLQLALLTIYLTYWR